jgi:hypothetical protein
MKIMMHSPTANSKLNNGKVSELIPPMYTRILEHSAHRLVSEYKQVFSLHLEKYETSQDKESLLKLMFSSLFTDSVIH